MEKKECDITTPFTGIENMESIDFLKECTCVNCVDYDLEANFCKKRNELVKQRQTCSLFVKKDKVDSEIMPVGLLKLDNYIDNVKQFKKFQPFFFDKIGVFWFWRNNKWEIVDDIDVMNSIDKSLNFAGQTVSRGIKGNYLEAMKRVGRSSTPQDAPKRWIQFNEKAFSLRSGKTYDVTHAFFFTNPIPWDLGKSTDTPTMDKLFKEWVGEEYVQTLYEIIAYCCYRDYPIHIVFCLVGAGRNGKTQFQKLIQKFLGKDNVCSTELDLLLESRFEAIKLFKKLACSLGETNFGVMNKTSLLKRLVGQDLIGFEFKQKQPFDDYNYAKILINSNSLPTSTDTSDGFYRRWLIVDFPNEFNEGKDIIETIPIEEYNNLALKITEIIPKLIKKGKFDKQGTIKERKHKYIMASNPLPIFIDKHCIKDFSKFTRWSEFFTAYVQYLKNNKRRRVSMSELRNGLAEEGFEVRRTSKKIVDHFETDRWIEGLELKTEENDKNYDNYDNYDLLSTSFTPQENQVEKGVQLSQLSQKPHDDLYTMMKNLADDNNNVFFIQKLYTKCAGKISRDFIDDEIEKMKKEGVIYEPKPDYISLL